MPLAALATMLPSPWTCIHTQTHRHACACACSKLHHKNVLIFDVKTPVDLKKVMTLSSKARIGAAILSPSSAAEVFLRTDLERLSLSCFFFIPDLFLHSCLF